MTNWTALCRETELYESHRKVISQGVFQKEKSKIAILKK